MFMYMIYLYMAASYCSTEAEPEEWIHSLS